MSDVVDQGGDPPCWAHLLDDDHHDDSVRDRGRARERLVAVARDDTERFAE